MENATVRASWSMPTDDSTKEAGIAISAMEKVLSATLMEIHIMAISKWAKHMAKEYTPGLTAKSMTVSGTWVSSQDTVSGVVFTTTPT